MQADGGGGGGRGGAVGGRGGLTRNVHWAERFSHNATLECTRWVVVVLWVAGLAGRCLLGHSAWPGVVWCGLCKTWGSEIAGQ